MHHFKTKEFRRRVRRKQCQRNQSERCCDNHCCCSAASASCNWAVHRLLGCYRSHLPSAQVFPPPPNPKLIRKKKKKKIEPVVTLFLFSPSAPVAWVTDNQPQGRISWTDSPLKRDAKIFPSSRILPKCFWEHTFPPLPITLLKSVLPITIWSRKIKGNYSSALFFYHPSPRYWRKKELAPCLQPLAL